MKAVRSQRLKRRHKGVLVLLGAGIYFPHDISVGTLEAVRKCRILFLHPVCRNLEKMLQPYCPAVKILKASQKQHSSDKLWQSIFWKTVKPWLDRGERVGYMSYGHPLLMADGYLLAKRASEQGYACESVPASTAIDSILSAMSFKPEILTEGFLVANATRMTRASRLNPSISTILFCLTYIGKYFLKVCRLIRKEYGAQHLVYIVRCGDSASVLCVKASELESLEKNIPSGASLVIPAKHG